MSAETKNTENKAPENNGSPTNPYKRNLKLTPEFMQKYSFQRQGQDVILVKGLVHLAHELGFRSIKTRFVEFPCEANNFTAFAETEVIDEFGRVFIDGGDANKENVGKMVAPHFPRMALTRSKGRALRDALGLPLLVDEELEVLIETAQGSHKRAEPWQWDRIKQLIGVKGRTREWVKDTIIKLFDCAPGEINEQQANILIYLLEELPDVPAQQTA